ncbi:hypothetical protein, partial [Bradyrhizobium sp.]|uniref:hypothetical protein n=1 Tax=Bradyrhizobium sp. TaxID=376 RepID=UPI003C18C415
MTEEAILKVSGFHILPNITHACFSGFAVNFAIQGQQIRVIKATRDTAWNQEGQGEFQSFGFRTVSRTRLAQRPKVE